MKVGTAIILSLLYVISFVQMHILSNSVMNSETSTVCQALSKAGFGAQQTPFGNTVIK